MKVSNEFILREVAGEYILVPVGAAAVKLNGLITLNEIGAFIFKVLQKEQTEESVVKKILEEYEIDFETATEDLKAFLQQMREIGVLVENA